jgi:hypothetical protein
MKDMNQYLIRICYLLIAILFVQCKNEDTEETIKSLSRIEEKIGINGEGKSIYERTLLIENYVSSMKVSSMLVGSGCYDTVENDYYTFLVFTRTYSDEASEELLLDLPNNVEIDEIQYDPRNGHFVRIKNLQKGNNEFSGYIINNATADSVLFKKTFYVK